jgi:fatty acid desaturase
MLAINALLIGLLAFSFSHGPYSSREQELWYRYGSIGFLIAGAILPVIALWFGALRSQWAVIALTTWMIIVLIACFLYALFSGGGV